MARAGTWQYLAGLTGPQKELSCRTELLGLPAAPPIGCHAISPLTHQAGPLPPPTTSLSSSPDPAYVIAATVVALGLETPQHLDSILFPWERINIPRTAPHHNIRYLIGRIGAGQTNADQ